MNLNIEPGLSALEVLSNSGFPVNASGTRYERNCWGLIVEIKNEKTAGVSKGVQRGARSDLHYFSLHRHRVSEEMVTTTQLPIRAGSFGGCDHAKHN